MPRRTDAYAGFNRLYDAGRKPGPIIEPACWSHARRKLYELAQLEQAPIAIEAVKRIDALFAIEREMNGAAPERRVAVRGNSRPLITALQAYLREQRAKLSGKSETARARMIWEPGENVGEPARGSMPLSLAVSTRV